MKLRVLHANKWGDLKIAALESFEKMIGSQLPSDYRDYLIAFNGGVPMLRTIKLSDKFGWTGIDYFLGLNDRDLSEGGTLISMRERDAKALPEDAINIGEDGCGVLFCYFVSGERKGQVFALEPSELHEMSMDDERRNSLSGEGAYFLSHTFTEFLTKLEENPDIEWLLTEGLTREEIG